LRLMRFSRYAYIALAVVLLFVLGLVFYRLALPRLVSYAPQGSSAGVAPTEPLVLEFSTPMQAETVASRLEVSPTVALSMTVDGARLIFTPVVWPAGQEIEVSLTSGAQAAGWLALPASQTVEWKFSVRPVMLAYLWPVTGSPDLYALAPLSGQILRLTQAAGVRDFAVSANGEWIYFTSDASGGGSRILRIGRMPDPEILATPEVVLDCPDALCRSVQAAPDGSWLAYERAPSSAAPGMAEVAVWVLDLRSREPRRLAPEDEVTRYPRWADTGALAVYNVSRQAYQVYFSGAGNVLEFPNQLGDPGSWESGGRAWVAPEYFEEIQSLLDPTSSGHLMRYSLVQPGQVQDLTQANNLQDIQPAFSPMGKRLAFARRFLDLQRWTVGQQLWVMDQDGLNGKALTNDPFYTYYDFAWSPDSAQIAFVRFNQAVLTEPAELWLVDADGSDLVQLVIGGFNPRWIP